MAACYIEPSEGPDAVPFTTGMRDRVIQTAPPAYCDTLVPVLSTLVGRTIQVAAQAVAHLGEIELARWVQGKERKLWVCRQRVRIVW